MWQLRRRTGLPRVQHGHAQEGMVQRAPAVVIEARNVPAQTLGVIIPGATRPIHGATWGNNKNDIPACADTCIDINHGKLSQRRVRPEGGDVESVQNPGPARPQNDEATRVHIPT